MSFTTEKGCYLIFGKTQKLSVIIPRLFDGKKMSNTFYL